MRISAGPYPIIRLVRHCSPAGSHEKAPIVLSDMGSFMFGGTTHTAKDGDTFHGGGESGKSWESTADGRDGFWQIFTREHWPAVIIDQPRRGRAGRTDAVAKASAVPTDHNESMAWNTFRIGTWAPPGKASVFRNSQFPQDAASVDQFMRWQTPNTGVEAFPDNDVPADIPSKMKFVMAANAPQLVPAGEFAELTRMPILIILGDNIATQESSVFGVELWRVNKQRAQQFVDTVNRHGGHATLLSLPDVGIHGNTHFAFADKNNQKIADLVTDYLHKQGLDTSSGEYILKDRH